MAKYAGIALALVCVFMLVNEQASATLFRHKNKKAYEHPTVVTNVHSTNVNEQKLKNYGGAPHHGVEHYGGHHPVHYAPNYVEPIRYHEPQMHYNVGHAPRRHGGGAATAAASAAGGGAASAAAAASGGAHEEPHYNYHVPTVHHVPHHGSHHYSPPCVAPPCYGGLYEPARYHY